MKTIFITGASTGLGKATAQLFQQRGWRVIATMRNPEAASDLASLNNVTILPLDITHPEQIRMTVKQALESGEVDVVFNNAGYGLMGPLEALADEQIVRQLNTNLLGTIRVTQEFIPYFREKKNGMFISTTSIGGLITFPLNSIYHATKWALEGWSESMAFELNTFGIDIKTVSPGGIKTDFVSRSLDSASSPAYEEIIDSLYSKMEGMMEAASTPEQIAEVVYEAATDGKKQLRYVAGDDANALYAQRLELGAEAFREQLGKQFL
ncbi:short-chain dehydrogenase/reductase [Chryseobacterium pennae]|uniref:Short-chain dehydrogenase/reductase n=1 Tax=Chryseobacterium pennae TaxID=2258962 RepID=A0A3D9CDJ3_9FLAO|nr:MULTISPECIES: SDR family oxidoreductase [Chryseobacterium]MCS4302817.1 NAD(P)-dependent dehydrogenase (short-subunit alcohol dehydrogenase family) [Chryseobacterium sp. BIGb0232]REC63804.1 short-chain dehydrogenase/reductase [Chryseobacterium pennae]ROS17469.1 NADP-dependent 3-hydroxy acid dehydrogenase YdfG [Chryseobacterium nakagawai]